MVTEGMLNFSNFDLQSVVTPVRVEMFQSLLTEAGYSARKTRFLINGFRNGFSLNYRGNKHVRIFSENLKLRGVDSKLILWNKVMKEVKEKRYAGPFSEPPFKYFIQSPIGLVPKDGGRDTRLIFHLSHPWVDPSKSVNANIPQYLCKVKYNDFDTAIQRCIEEGQFCAITKSDMKSTFRHVCIRISDFCWLVMKAECPADGKTYFYVDKALPFGSSISCKIFQEFSDSIAFLVQYRTNKILINYLDDYLFIQYLKQQCNDQVREFLTVCRQINFPVSMEKMFWAAHILTFLGLLINTISQTVSIPIEKIEKGKELLLRLLPKQKITVAQLEELTGFLNFPM